MRSVTGRKPTEKQQVALDWLAAGATVDEAIDAAGVKGGDDNRAAFLYRLARAGLVTVAPA